MADLRINKLFLELNALRSKFGTYHAAEKLALLDHCVGFEKASKRAVIEFHELLLFFITYPDSPAFLRKVKEVMRILSGHLYQLSQKRSAQFHHQFDGTGLAFSSNSWKPSMDACKWMLCTFPEDVELNWDADFAEKIGPFLSIFSSRAEQDGLTNDRFDAKDWLMLASGAPEGKATEQLSYILNRFSSFKGDPYLLDYLFETLGPEVCLRLNHPIASRTTNLITPPKVFFQRESLTRDFDPSKLLRKKIAPLKKLPAAESIKMISMARAVLAARNRETDPFSYAGDVWQADLDRGLCIYLFSMFPERRMPIENYTGFLALRNGVPIGYGGGWIFIERCEIGVNIFETFRGGENSYIFTNILRVYNQVFGIKQFAVPPYQFGADNDEGLKSGAFWFYYKLGFRPCDETLKLLATSEAYKIEQDKKYHSPLKILKKLATYPLELKTGNSRYQLEPKQIGIVLTKWITKKFKSDHESATQWCLRQLKSQVAGMKYFNKWPESERTALNNLAVFLVLPGIINTLSAAEKTELTQLIRLKAGDEIKYSSVMKKQKKLFDAWQLLVNEELTELSS